jgi:hypothetical protein
MARARGIKPGFYKNEELAECSIWARYIFPGLWMLADREGRLEDRPRRIKGELLPFDGQDVDALLDELVEHDFIVRYEVDGERYIQVLAFEKHQNPHHREPPSSIPKPGASPRPRGDATASKPEASPGQALGKTEARHPSDDGRAPEKPGSAVLTPSSLTPSSLTPDPGLLTADCGPRTPDPGEKQHLAPGATPPAARKARRANGEDTLRTSATWHAYSEAYLARYGTEPVRNATVNAQIAGFVKRIGAQEAPGVAAFYVSHGRGLYVSAKHSVNLMLRDCEGLRTEWATGRQVTDTQARQADSTAATSAVFDKLISEAGP